MPGQPPGCLFRTDPSCSPRELVPGEGISDGPPQAAPLTALVKYFTDQLSILGRLLQEPLPATIIQWQPLEGKDAVEDVFEAAARVAMRNLTLAVSYLVALMQPMPLHTHTFP